MGHFQFSIAMLNYQRVYCGDNSEDRGFAPPSRTNRRKEKANSPKPGAVWWTLGDEGWWMLSPSKNGSQGIDDFGDYHYSIYLYILICILYPIWSYMIITMISYVIQILFKSKQSLGEYRNPGRIPFSFAKKPGAWEVLRSRRAL